MRLAFREKAAGMQTLQQCRRQYRAENGLARSAVTCPRSAQIHSPNSQPDLSCLPGINITASHSALQWWGGVGKGGLNGSHREVISSGVVPMVSIPSVRVDKHLLFLHRLVTKGQ